MAVNRRAHHEYLIEDRFEAGLVLTGTEIKSIRAGKVNLRDAYARVERGEAWLIGADIAAWTGGNRYNHEPKRDRKLLLHRRQIDELMGKAAAKGLTIVPLRLYIRRPGAAPRSSSAWRAASSSTTAVATSPRATPAATWSASWPTCSGAAELRAPGDGQPAPRRRNRRAPVLGPRSLEIASSHPATGVLRAMPQCPSADRPATLVLSDRSPRADASEPPCRAAPGLLTGSRVVPEGSQRPVRGQATLVRRGVRA